MPPDAQIALEGHLSNIYEAVKAWETYQTKQNAPKDESTADKGLSLLEKALSTAVSKDEQPKYPQPMSMYYRLKKYQNLYWGVSLSEQPAILTLEMDAVEKAIFDYAKEIEASQREYLEIINKRLQMKKGV